MEKSEILELLKKYNVLLEGHFLLTSGNHSDKYMQCAKIFEVPELSIKLCGMLVDKIKNLPIDVVIGPAIGAIDMSYEMGRQLNVRNIFAERENGKMTLRRNFEIKPGEKVLVVEDVTTTGGSVREVIDLVRSFGADVVCVAAIVDRSGGKIDFGVRFESVLKMDIEFFPPENCPLCKKGIPLVHPGSRKISA
jgi:orotate phosphoribosyltransferase